MYHFFVMPEQIADGCAVITGQDVNHIKNVLRMKQGQQIGVRDGISRSYICELERFEPDKIYAVFSQRRPVLQSFLRSFICFRDFQRATRWNW